MAGCYGTSKEDRHYERMLDRHLDATDAAEQHEELIQARVDELWEKLASPIAAEKFANDYELFVNHEGEILSAIAYAKRTGDKEFVADALIGLVDRKLTMIAQGEMEGEV